MRRRFGALCAIQYGTESIGGHHQYEPFGDSDLVGHLQGCAGDGKVADQTIDGTTVKPDSSGLQNAVSGCPAAFGHEINLSQNSKQQLKLIVALGANLTFH
jgi:hypothetical protein